MSSAYNPSFRTGLGPYLFVRRALSYEQWQKETHRGVVWQAGEQEEASINMYQAHPPFKVSDQGKRSAVRERFMGAVAVTRQKAYPPPSDPRKGPEQRRLTSGR